MKLCTAIKSILKIACVFWQNCCNFDFDISDINLQDRSNVFRVMGEDGARGMDWLRARGHHLCLTDIIF